MKTNRSKPIVGMVALSALTMFVNCGGDDTGTLTSPISRLEGDPNGPIVQEVRLRCATFHRFNDYSNTPSTDLPETEDVVVPSVTVAHPMLDYQKNITVTVYVLDKDDQRTEKQSILVGSYYFGNERGMEYVLNGSAHNDLRESLCSAKTWSVEVSARDALGHDTTGIIQARVTDVRESSIKDVPPTDNVTPSPVLSEAAACKLVMAYSAVCCKVSDATSQKVINFCDSSSWMPGEWNDLQKGIQSTTCEELKLTPGSDLCNKLGK